MISITLNFTSIEAARQALLDIPSNLLAQPVVTDVPKKAEKIDTSEKRVQKTAKNEQVVEAPKPEPVVETAPTEPTAVEAPVAAPEPKPTPSIDYPTLQKAVFALATKSRDAAAAVAASFNVKTFKELGQDKWSEALGAVTEKLAELEAA